MRLRVVAHSSHGRPAGFGTELGLGSSIDFAGGKCRAADRKQAGPGPRLEIEEPGRSPSNGGAGGRMPPGD
jgi:hypothetical protein